MQQATLMNLQYQASKGNSSFPLMQIILLQSVHNLDEEYPFYLQIDLEDFSMCNTDTVNKISNNLNHYHSKYLSTFLCSALSKDLSLSKCRQKVIYMLL